MRAIMPKPSYPRSSGSSYGDRKPSFGGRKPSFGDRKPSFGARKSYGDKPAYSDRKPSYGGRSERPSYGDRKPSYGDKPAYGARKSYGDRKPSYGDKPAYGEKKPYVSRPWGDRKPMGGAKSFGDRKPYGERKSYGDRKPSYGDKPAYEKKSYGDRAEKRPFSDRPFNSENSSRKTYISRSSHGPKSSWEPVAPWYDDYMGKSGGDYQQDVVFPAALKLLNPKADHTYLDLACGNGAFSHLVTTKVSAKTVGIDASPTLISSAKAAAKKNETFEVGDARTALLQRDENEFDGAVINLAIQNIDPLESMFRGLARVMKKDATLVITMNHPGFRQPRQSGWGWDEERKLQFRRIDRYLTEYEQPIQMHPGASPDEKTYSYHRPLQTYINALARHGFMVDGIEELISNRVSDSGPKAKAENFARNEFPLFMAIRAIKIK
ncbi:MAG: methyltransferase domain-containing protein [Patescibacteria group bacterium]